MPYFHLCGCQGIVLNEPSVVAIDADTKRPLAVGSEAREMLEKFSKSRHGNPNYARAMLESLSKIQ